MPLTMIKEQKEEVEGVDCERFFFYTIQEDVQLY